jgi:hypothetical protein
MHRRLGEHEQWPGQPAARDTDQLAAIANNRLKRIQYSPARIDGSSPRPDSPLQPRTAIDTSVPGSRVRR